MSRPWTRYARGNIGAQGARPTLNLKEMQQVAGRMGRCVATFPPGARCLLCAVFALMVGLRLPWHRRRVSKAARDAFKYTRMLLLMVQGRGYYSYNNFPVAPGVRSDASRSREYTGGGFLSQCDGIFSAHLQM